MKPPEIRAEYVANAMNIWELLVIARIVFEPKRSLDSTTGKKV